MSKWLSYWTYWWVVPWSQLGKLSGPGQCVATGPVQGHGGTIEVSMKARGCEMPTHHDHQGCPFLPLSSDSKTNDLVGVQTWKQGTETRMTGRGPIVGSDCSASVQRARALGFHSSYFPPGKLTFLTKLHDLIGKVTRGHMSLRSQPCSTV